jgi:NAD-dependent dihydropyrimidine dehydrogenase PreA subunit
MECEAGVAKNQHQVLVVEDEAHKCRLCWRSIKVQAPVQALGLGAVTKHHGKF